MPALSAASTRSRATPSARALLRHLAGDGDALLLTEEERTFVASRPDRTLEVPAGAPFLGVLREVLADAEGERLWALALTYEAGRSLHARDSGATLREERALPRLVALRYPAWVELTPGQTRLRGAGPGRARLQALLEAPAAPPPEGRASSPPRRDLDDAAYAERFEAIQEDLRAGRYYQLNLTCAHRFGWAGDPLALFERLAGDRWPARAGYLDAGDLVLASASPELLLAFDPVTRIATSGPIKGTRPAPADPIERARLARALREDPKERAEHVMIVDLTRNDLSRVCLPGTVRARAPFALLQSGPVQHLVTLVEGVLAPEHDLFDLACALLPGGSVTGAPKVAALEAIDRLEVAPRGFYCGALGRAGPGGALSLTLPIRTATLLAEGRRDRWRATYPSGGGIVEGASMAGELGELELKAERLRRALG